MISEDLAWRLREPPRYDFIGSLIAGWRAMRHHRRERAMVVAIARLSPRLIRDIGLDPEQILKARHGRLFSQLLNKEGR